MAKKNYSSILGKTLKNKSSFARAVTELKVKLSCDEYEALQSTIIRAFPWHVSFVLTPKRHKTWSGLSNNQLLSSIDLDKQLIWQIVQFNRSKSILSSHFEYVSELNQLLAQDNLKEAKLVLDRHFEEFGATLWNLEAQISISNKINREAVEELLLKINEQFPSGWVALVCIYLGDIYDSDTSYRGFLARLRDSLSKREESIVSNYLVGKFITEDASEKQLEDYLSIESSFSILDSYESVINVLQNFPYRRVDLFFRIIDYLIPLENIKDCRLDNFIQARKQYIGADKEAGLKSDMNAPRLEEFLNFEDSSVKKDRKNNVEAVLRDAVDVEAQWRQDYYQTYSNLISTLSKYRFMPWFSQMYYALDGVFHPFARNNTYLTTCALTAQSTGLIAKARDNSVKSILEAQGTYNYPWLKLYEANSSSRELYLKIINHCLDGCFGEAKKLVANIINKLESDNLGLLLLKVSVLIECDAEEEALKVCSYLATEVHDISYFLPFEDLLKNKDYTELKEFDQLDVLIGLYCLTLMTKDSKAKFNLQFTCKSFLKSLGAASLVEIANHYQLDDPRVHFVLGKVFSSSNLRMVAQLSTVEDVENARLEVCQYLLEHKSQEEDEVVKEIKDITWKKDLRQAEKDVESTRVYVNKDGMKLWAEKKYREQFIRIKKSRQFRLAPTIDQIEAD